jgi:hypothetical protein
METAELTTVLFQSYTLLHCSADRAELRGFAKMALGRNPKDLAEVDAVMSALVEAGIVEAAQKCRRGFKGCAGGRSRPSYINVYRYSLTEKGRASWYAWADANPDQLDDWHARWVASNINNR